MESYSESYTDVMLDMAESYVEVATALRQATLEVTSDEFREALLELEYGDFWREHLAIVERAEAAQPGTAEQIFARTDELMEARKQAAEMALKEEIRAIRKTAFKKAIFGLD